MNSGSQNAAKDVAPEGGYGWVVVLAAFIANAVGFGILYSFGVFFPRIIDEFGQGRGGTSIVVSVAAAVLLGAGGLIGRLTNRYGPKIVVTVGGVLVGLGLLLTSVATQIWQVYLAYGLLLGFGISASFLPPLAAVGQWFDRRRGLASGLAVAGSGAGGVILSPLAESLISSVGWRPAARAIAIGGAVLLFVAASLVRTRYERRSESVLHEMRADPVFRKLYLTALVSAYGYWVPFVHLVPYARDRGISAATAALLLALMGASNTLGRIVLGAVADRIGRLSLFQAAMWAMAIATLVWPFADDVVALGVFSVAYGLVAGAFISVLPALTGDYFGVQRLAGIYGLLNTGAALGSLVGSPVSGWLFDVTGSYTVAIVIAGTMMAIGATVMLRLPKPQTR